jgi:hypothetical protein
MSYCPCPSCRALFGTADPLAGQRQPNTTNAAAVTFAEEWNHPSMDVYDAPDDLTHYMQKCSELTAAVVAAEARIAALHGIALGRCNAELEVRIADLEKQLDAARSVLNAGVEPRRQIEAELRRLRCAFNVWTEKDLGQRIAFMLRAEETRLQLADAVQALRDAVRQVEGGRKGYVGDHWIFTPQISERSLTEWLNALAKLEPKP